MTPGIYLQRRRERIGRSGEWVASLLEMQLVAGGLQEDYRLKFRLEEAVRLIEHDMLIAPPAVLAGLASIEALEFCPEDYAALARYAADPAHFLPPPVCRSCGEKVGPEHDRLCKRCIGWASTRRKFALSLDRRGLSLGADSTGMMPALEGGAA